MNDSAQVPPTSVACDVSTLLSQGWPKDELAYCQGEGQPRALLIDRVRGTLCSLEGSAARVWDSLERTRQLKLDDLIECASDALSETGKLSPKDAEIAVELFLADFWRWGLLRLPTPGPSLSEVTLK